MQNTEATKYQNKALSIGVILRNAREELGLSQQAVAEHLCLKVSTIRNIEEDKVPADLALTFLRGYIRSYAKLMHIPEKDIFPIMEKQGQVIAAKVAPMQRFYIAKKRNCWLISFTTWLVSFLVIAITSAWWLQKNKAQQEEINIMADQYSAGEFNNSNNKTANIEQQNSIYTIETPVKTTNEKTYQASVAKKANILKNTDHTAEADTNLNNLLVINFSADCWLSVTDATEKTIFSGLQHKNGHLIITGKAPYKLKIGAPAAVNIKFQGKYVDLNRFIKPNQVAHLTLNAE